MLIEEAKWLSQKILTMDPSTLFPALNVGSSNAEVRENIQPWINEYIFRPIKMKQQKIRHLDIKRVPSVDIVGDLMDPRFLEKLSKMRFKSVLCSNLLEHIPNKEEVCRILASIIPVGGYIFVSGPYNFPLHPDPIDNMFRPDIHELANLFPNTCLICGEIVTCGNQLDYFRISKFIVSRTRISKALTAGTKTHWVKKVKNALNRLPWLFRNFQATCLVLQKCTETPPKQIIGLSQAGKNNKNNALIASTKVHCESLEDSSYNARELSASNLGGHNGLCF